MRVTVKQYERAKKAVEKLSKHRQTVDAWEKAVKEIPPGVTVESVKIVDGKITFEGQTKKKGLGQ